MNKLKFAYLLIIGSLILLIINVYNLDFDNLKKENYWGIVSNLLLVVGMTLTIKGIKNREKK